MSTWQQRLAQQAARETAEASASSDQRQPPIYAVVSQIGQRTKFQAVPRWARESEISVIDGAIGLEEAVRLAFRRPPTPRDSVRQLSVELLTIAGYEVWADPIDGNPRHASMGRQSMSLRWISNGGGPNRRV